MKRTISFCTMIMVIFFACRHTFAQGQHRTKNMLIILIDGYRWQELFRGADDDLLFNPKYNPDDSATRMQKYWAKDVSERREKLMPFTWNYIAKHGQLYGNRDLGDKVNVRNPYWISYPGRAEVLSGFVDSAINSNSYPDNPNMNVLEFIDQQKGYHGRVVTFACWDATGRCLHKDKSNMLINVPWEDIPGDDLTPAEQLANELQHYTPKIFGNVERLDVNVYALAKSYIQAKHPKVTYIDFGDPDEYAHAGKYEGYLRDIHHLDAMIGELWHMMQQDPFYKGNTTFVIMPDHGRGVGAQWTSHGSGTPHSDETWLMVMGPDTPASGEMTGPGQIYQTQYAKTIAQFLGFTYKVNGHAVGNDIQTAMR